MFAIQTETEKLASALHEAIGNLEQKEFSQQFRTLGVTEENPLRSLPLNVAVIPFFRSLIDAKQHIFKDLKRPKNYIVRTSVSTLLPPEKLSFAVTHEANEIYFSDLLSIFEFSLAQISLDADLKLFLDATNNSEQKAAALELYYQVKMECIIRLIDELLAQNKESIKSKKEARELAYMILGSLQQNAALLFGGTRFAFRIAREYESHNKVPNATQPHGQIFEKSVGL